MQTYTQIYGFCAPDEASALQQCTSICVTQTSQWMKVNRLQLNTAKSEQLWCTSPRQQNRLPNIALHVGCDIVQPVSSVRNLGIFIDSEVSMKTHISKTVSSYFTALPRLCSIRRSVSQAVLFSLVTSLIMTRLDYGSSVLAGLPSHLLNRLQSVLNAAARLVCRACKYDHVTHLLRDLHWLRVPERIQFRLAVQRAFVSRWRAPLDWRGGITASTTVRFLSMPDRSANAAQHHRRPIISCDCRTCMEQSSYQYHGINLCAIFQETT